MYTRILIATGGSPWSDAAAAYAIALAAHMGADLCILTVLNVSGVYAMPDVMASSELLMESVEQQGQEMLAHTAARAIHAGVPQVALLKWGNVAETILQTAAEEQCDLIVLGSRGLSGFKRLMRQHLQCGGSQSPMSGPGDQAATSGALALASCPRGHRWFSLVGCCGRSRHRTRPCAAT
jgi:nucleotide-binding universal stress UspA family protein